MPINTFLDADGWALEITLKQLACQKKSFELRKFQRSFMKFVILGSNRIVWWKTSVGPVDKRRSFARGCLPVICGRTTITR